jgi:hypothetical protein
VKAGAGNRVNDEIAGGDFREVQLPGLRVGDLDDGDADAAEDLEVDARVAPRLRDAAEQEDERFDAALGERARDDEAVAAVVAAAAENVNGDAREFVDRRLYGGDGLAARVLHQHHGRNPDLVDRLPIGLAHLLRVEHPHRRLLLTILRVPRSTQLCAERCM